MSLKRHAKYHVYILSIDVSLIDPMRALFHAAEDSSPPPTGMQKQRSL